jgi:galactose mutarotase-like enzyme
VISTTIELRAREAAATISPDEGGMLLSLQIRGHELLVQRRPGTEPVPTFGSFLMAPWVGELSQGEVDFRGGHAQIPPNKGRHAIHGLVATGAWDVADLGPTAARLVRRLPEEPWPFGGVVTQDIRLPGLQLRLHFDPSIETVVVYTSPGAVCVEPWSAWPDAFRMASAGHPSGAVVLEPGETLRRWTRWEWSLGMDNAVRP